MRVALTEVYSSNRPGRPVLMLVLCAALLCGTLGLAWMQSRVARALGPLTAIPGTPLAVCPPPGWISSRNRPGLFEQISQVRRTIWGDQQQVARRIEIGYRQFPHHVSAADALLKLGLADREALETALPAKIGKFDGVEVRWESAVQIGRRAWIRGRLVRAATLPRGDVIFVDYQPLGQITLGDQTLLNDVCATVQVESVGLGASRAALQRRLAARIDIDAAWRIDLAEADFVAGAHIAGAGYDGDWSLSLFRSWLGPQRSLQDLAREAIANTHAVAADAVPCEPQSSAGARGQVFRARWRLPSDAGNEMREAWVIGQSPQHVLLVLVFGDGDGEALGSAAAERICRTAQLADLPAFAQLDAMRGRGLAEIDNLRAGNVRSLWGDRARQSVYQLRHGAVDGRYEVSRRPIRGSAPFGYEGAERTRIDTAAGALQVVDAQEWVCDVGGRQFEQRRSIDIGAAQVRISDRLERGESRMSRSIGDERATIALPPDFVPSPLFDVFAYMSLRGAGASTVATTLSAFGSKACEVMITALPSPPDRPRALIRWDFDPAGHLYEFDAADGELRRIASNGVQIERLTDL